MEIQDIDKPKGIGRLTNLEMLKEQRFPPKKILEMMDPDAYEDMIAEWAISYLENDYCEVKQLGGSGDKGRDVCGYTDDTHCVYDIYQCKHYKDPLSPSKMLIEFAKLVYFTFTEDYRVPRKYYFVSPQGVSTALWEMLEHPERIKNKLLNEWEDKISNRITSTKKIDLTPELEQYIKQFDFSIVNSLEPELFIEQFATTRYYACRFGGGLRKREKTQVPELNNTEFGMVYVQELFRAYESHLCIPINDLKSFSSNDTISTHFKNSRNSFYSAESLEQFSRDNIADEEEDSFTELKEEVFEQVFDTCTSDYIDGFARVKATTEAAKNGNYQVSNLLHDYLKVQDRTGLCHYLVNEKRLKWIYDEE